MVWGTALVLEIFQTSPGDALVQISLDTADLVAKSQALKPYRPVFKSQALAY